MHCSFVFVDLMDSWMGRSTYGLCWNCWPGAFSSWGKKSMYEYIWVQHSDVNFVGIQKKSLIALQWRHNGRDGVSNYQPHHCLLNRLLRRKSKKTSKLRVIGLCAGNSPVTGQMASNAENASVRWRHHGFARWVNVCSFEICRLFSFHM